MEEEASRILLIKNFKNLQEKLLKCNSSLFHGILFCLHVYVAYNTLAEWDCRNMLIGKYISECTVVKFCVCLEFKKPPD